MNYGRERGTAKPGVSNGQFNPAILQNDRSGEVRLFLAGMTPDTENASSLSNNSRLTINGRPTSNVAYAAMFVNSPAGAYAWTSQTSNFGGTGINAIAYGNGVWVAVGASGTLRTSTNNAVTWNTQTSNFGATTINAVAYGNGVWVAVGSGGALRTSTNDGITWNTQTSNTTVILTTVAYGDGVWVAAGSAGIRTSTNNAVTWNTQTSNFGATIINAVAYGNGVWLAGGVNGAIRRGSSTGVSWTTIFTGSIAATINTLLYSEGVWLVGYSGATLRSSTDNSLTWNTQVTGVSSIFSIAYGNRTWIAAGTPPGTINMLRDVPSYYAVDLQSSYNVAGYLNQ